MLVKYSSHHLPSRKLIDGKGLLPEAFFLRLSIGTRRKHAFPVLELRMVVAAQPALQSRLISSSPS